MIWFGFQSVHLPGIPSIEQHNFLKSRKVVARRSRQEDHAQQRVSRSLGFVQGGEVSISYSKTSWMLIEPSSALRVCSSLMATEKDLHAECCLLSIRPPPAGTHGHHHDPPRNQCLPPIPHICVHTTHYTPHPGPEKKNHFIKICMFTTI